MLNIIKFNRTFTVSYKKYLKYIVQQTHVYFANVDKYTSTLLLIKLRDIIYKSRNFKN